MPDIDIDVLNREEFLSHLKYIHASRINENAIERHNTGIYVQDVPIDHITGLCSIDYRVAEEHQLQKIDVINNSSYCGVRNEEHLDLLLHEPDWSKLENQEFVEKLPHVHNHFHVLNQMKPKSIEELAMVLALIRPGKSHLIGRTWNDIEKEIWSKSQDQYSFKKSHAFAYALLIIMRMNLLEKSDEKLAEEQASCG